MHAEFIQHAHCQHADCQHADCASCVAEHDEVVPQKFAPEGIAVRDSTSSTVQIECQ
jgi:hypothetical protein